jgi:predicted aminopeptidase
MKIVMGKEPVATVIADQDTDEQTRRRLQVALDARQFAINKLHLPKNDSYTSYYDTGRNFVTWNVIAADEFSLKPKTWCFPIAGCVSYRGYYAREAASGYAKKLEEAGMDVAITGATAYSTLGWFDDPLLNTILNRSDADITALIIHELAHQQLYVSDDSTFNESFATFVEQEGVRRWQNNNPVSSGTDLVQQMALRMERKRDFLDLLNNTKTGLLTLYASDESESEMRRQKQQHFEQMKRDYSQLKEAWGGYQGYDGWFARPLNNARLAAVGTYNDYLPAFSALFDQSGKDFKTFYRASRELAEMPREMRNKRLSELAQAREAAIGTN